MDPVEVEEPEPLLELENLIEPAEQLNPFDPELPMDAAAQEEELEHEMIVRRLNRRQRHENILPHVNQARRLIGMKMYSAAAKCYLETLDHYDIDIRDMDPDVKLLWTRWSRTKNDFDQKAIFAVAMEKRYGWSLKFLPRLVSHMISQQADGAVFYYVRTELKKSLDERKVQRFVRSFAEAMLYRLGNLAFPQWHIKMVNDQKRNKAYRDALLKSIKSSEDVVFDIGAGTGLLSCYAAEKSSNVIAIEANFNLYRIAEDVVLRNTPSVKCLYKWSYDYKPEKKANVIVSEILDCCIVGEHVIDVFIHAHRELAAPNCVFIPQKAHAYAYYIQNEELWKEHAKSYHGPRGDIEFRSEFVKINKKGPKQPYTSKPRFPFNDDVKMMTSRKEILELDFTSEEALIRAKDRKDYFTVDVKAAGKVHFICVDFGVKLLDDGDKENFDIDTSDRSCWDVGLFPLQEPIEVDERSSLTFQMSLKNGRLDLATMYPREMLKEMKRKNYQEFENVDFCWVGDEVVPHFIEFARNHQNLQPIISSDMYRLSFCQISSAYEKDAQFDGKVLLTWPFDTDHSVDSANFNAVLDQVRADETIKKVFPERLQIYGQFFRSDEVDNASRLKPENHFNVNLKALTDAREHFEYRDINELFDVDLIGEPWPLFEMSMDVEKIREDSEFGSWSTSRKKKVEQDASIDGIIYYHQFDGGPVPKRKSAFTLRQRSNYKMGEEMEITCTMVNCELFVTGSRC